MLRYEPALNQSRGILKRKNWKFFKSHEASVRKMGQLIWSPQTIVRLILRMNDGPAARVRVEMKVLEQAPVLDIANRRIVD
jgi:hypothetical protein